MAIKNKLSCQPLIIRVKTFMRTARYTKRFFRWTCPISDPNLIPSADIKVLKVIAPLLLSVKRCSGLTSAFDCDWTTQEQEFPSDYDILLTAEDTGLPSEGYDPDPIGCGHGEAIADIDDIIIIIVI